MEIFFILVNIFIIYCKEIDDFLEEIVFMRIVIIL